MELKDIIKNRRSELQLTLDDVARRVGVNRATVLRWEQGAIKNLGRDKIAALAAALQVSPEYLLGWTDDPGIQLETDLATATADLTQEERESVLHYIQFLKSQRGRG